MWKKAVCAVTWYIWPFTLQKKQQDMEEREIIECQAWRLGKGATQEALLESFRETEEEIGCFSF